jgi:Glutathione-dependent formaldehyde-activating enzyme
MVCHCKKCQKQTGTSFSVILSVPSVALMVEGNLPSRDRRLFHDQKFALVASVPTKCQPTLRKAAIVPHSLVRGMASHHLLD